MAVFRVLVDLAKAAVLMPLPSIRALLSALGILVLSVSAPMAASAQSPSLEALIKSGALPAIPKKPRSSIKIDAVQQNGRMTLVLFSERDPLTRTAIHRHDSSGVTCITAGEMTLYLEGKDPIRKRAGECYYMPSGVSMIGYNSGRGVARFYDFFNYPVGSESLRVVEAGGCEARTAALAEFCDDNPYMHQH